MSEPFILFEVDGATYAVRSTEVQQVEMIQGITYVPNAPEFVEGVVYLRGKVVPVISLRKRFHLSQIPYDLRSRLIITHVGQRQIGLAVDMAREFRVFNEDDILPTPEEFKKPGLEYMQGVVNLDKRLVVIVDLTKLLNEAEQVESVHWEPESNPVKAPDQPPDRPKARSKKADQKEK